MKPLLILALALLSACATQQKESEGSAMGKAAFEQAVAICNQAGYTSGEAGYACSTYVARRLIIEQYSAMRAMTPRTVTCSPSGGGSFTCTGY